MKTCNGCRKSVKWALVALVSGTALCAAVGEEKKCPVSANVRGRENIEWSISYAYGLTDETCNLPRVLLIGDSICNGYQRGVRERLKGKMNVTYWVSSYCVTSPAYLSILSVYLDGAKYDVIHFNNGLHSLSTTTDAWAKGLKATLAFIREKQPQAKIVWCSSTPLTDSGKTAKCRELNAAAARVVGELGGIATDDLFALCDPLDRAENWCDEYHFRPEAKARQADQVASAALSAVSLAANLPAYGATGAPEEKPPLRIFSETAEQKAQRMAWWTHDRFGMFIHFGLYAVPARHEWMKSREGMVDRDYDRYLEHFNPDLYDAKEWARAAKAAGMKYAVLTTKHHEGFCMWDTDTTDYKITKTEFGRDLVREFVDAFRAEGLRVGFYYSIIDWRHPDFTIDRHHPLFKHLPDGSSMAERVAKANEGRDMARYRKYMFNQVEELLTRYGKIDIVWFDYVAKGEYGKSWRDYDSVELIKLARRLQPECIVDSRLDLMETEDGWDFVTPEQYKVLSWPTVRGRKAPWETCQTFSGSWGYHRDETTWKDMPQLVELLSETVSRGGNLILNVGPTARGVFDERAMDRFAGFAKWMRFNSRSIYGCTAAPEGFAAPNGTALTYNPDRNTLYAHLYDYPMGFLPLAFHEKVKYAQFLHDGSELVVKHLKMSGNHDQEGDRKRVGGIVLPVPRPDVVVPVVEMFL